MNCKTIACAITWELSKNLGKCSMHVREIGSARSPSASAKGLLRLFIERDPSCIFHGFVHIVLFLRKLQVGEKLPLVTPVFAPFRHFTQPRFPLFSCVHIGEFEARTMTIGFVTMENVIGNVCKCHSNIFVRGKRWKNIEHLLLCLAFCACKYNGQWT